MTLKKTNRKRRLPRLTIAPANDQPCNFRPSDDEWLRIQGAYGVVLNDIHRGEIREFVDEYLYFQPIERSAPFVADAEKWVTRLKKSVQRTTNAMSDMTIDRRNIRDAVAHVQIDIFVSMQKLENDDRIRWTDIGRFMRNIEDSCANSIQDLQKWKTGGGFVEGNVWDLLANRLIDWAKNNQFPATIAKGSDKIAGENVSKFVKFFAQIQATLPANYRRHTQSKSALSQALALARRKARGTVTRSKRTT